MIPVFMDAKIVPFVEVSNNNVNKILLLCKKMKCSLVIFLFLCTVKVESNENEKFYDNEKGIVTFCVTGPWIGRQRSDD